MHKVIPAIIAIVLFSASISFASDVGFHEALLTRGIASYNAGEYANAAKELRVAAFGLLDDTAEFQRAEIYLTLVYRRTAKADLAKMAAEQVAQAQEIRATYAGLSLPASIRTAFNTAAAELLTPTEIAVLSRPDGPGTVTPQPQIVQTQRPAPIAITPSPSPVLVPDSGQAAREAEARRIADERAASESAARAEAERMAEMQRARDEETERALIARSASEKAEAERISSATRSREEREAEERRVAAAREASASDVERTKAAEAEKLEQERVVAAERAASEKLAAEKAERARTVELSRIRAEEERLLAVERAASAKAAAAERAELERVERAERARAEQAERAATTLAAEQSRQAERSAATQKQREAAARDESSRLNRETAPSQYPGAPFDSPPVLKALLDADAALLGGDLIEAGQIYRRVLDTDALTRSSLLRLAEGFYRTREFRLSLEAFARIGAINEGEEAFRYYAAVALYEIGEYRAAKRQLECALPFIDSSAEVQRYRTRIEAGLGR